MSNLPVLLRVKLNGGLCNKLHHLFSACQYAVQENIPILEPFLGWKAPVRFSSIYDMQIFNENLKGIFKGKDIMVSQDEQDGYNVIDSNIDLWADCHEKWIRPQRRGNFLDRQSTLVTVLSALVLNRNLLSKISTFSALDNVVGVHVRNESDWKKYATIKKQQNNDALIFVPCPTIVSMVASQWPAQTNSDVLFSAGEFQRDISVLLQNKPASR
jgi:hypothetical protein